MTELNHDGLTAGAHAAATLPHKPAGTSGSDKKGSISIKSSSSDVGAALRNAFRATVDEEVPNEMLDLLRRLD